MRCGQRQTWLSLSCGIWILERTSMCVLAASRADPWRVTPALLTLEKDGIDMQSDGRTDGRYRRGQRHNESVHFREFQLRHWFHVEKLIGPVRQIRTLAFWRLYYLDPEIKGRLPPPFSTANKPHIEGWEWGYRWIRCQWGEGRRREKGISCCRVLPSHHDVTNVVAIPWLCDIGNVCWYLVSQIVCC